MKAIASFSLFFLICFSLNALETPNVANPRTTRMHIVPVLPSPESNNVNSIILQPVEGTICPSDPVNMQVLLEGFPLGTNSSFPRAEQIRNSSKGQSLNFVIDTQPAISVNEEVINSLDGTENYFDDMINVDIPWALEKGEHLLRVFPSRSFGEGIKGDGAFTTRLFYFQEEGPEIYDIYAPFITYNQPTGKYQYDIGGPILLDFYVSNCELSTDGYRVKLMIDGQQERMITLWVPYYIYGLKPGTHNVRLELIDPKGNLVPGKLSVAEQTIEIVK